MQHKAAATLLLALVAIGCAHRQGAAPPPPPEAADVDSPATGPARQSLIDEVVRRELNRNCFGVTTSTRSTAPSQGP